MKGYRIHIDIPLGDDEKKSFQKTKNVMGMLEKEFARFASMGIEQLNIRLGHDDDRQKSNYLIKDENDHVSNKKLKMIVKLTPTHDVE
tara:strand:- start:52 stop:315 length:264 start_codon:yes stop_codon:yes gene_type:complete